VIYAVLAVMAVVFVEIFIRTGLPRRARSVLEISRESLGVLASRSLDDEQKEQLIRRNAATLLAASLGVGFRLLLIAAAIGAIYVVAARGLDVPEQDLSAGLLSPAGALLLTLAGLAYVGVRHVLCQRL
jgi:hypothetical protein